jgi:hypothetical protein
VNFNWKRYLIFIGAYLVFCLIDVCIGKIVADKVINLILALACMHCFDTNEEAG